MAGEHSRRAQEGGPEEPTHKVLAPTCLSPFDVFLRITHPGPSREACGTVDHRPVLATGYSGSWGQVGSMEKVMVFTRDPCPGVMGVRFLSLFTGTRQRGTGFGGQGHRLKLWQPNLHREGPPLGEITPKETVS